jgi:uncharacterized protein YndB with AHSA1/START domain
VGVPTKGSATITIDARPEEVYDLVADVTRMGEWSPECVSCEWLDSPGAEGSRFRGRNRNGLARWTTTAKVLRAERGVEFTFATLHRNEISTRWTYQFEGDDTTNVTESFEAVRVPALIALLERTVTRRRQEELEAGLRSTLERLKVVAETANGSP